MTKFIEVTDENDYNMIINIDEISLIYKDIVDIASVKTIVVLKSGVKIIVKESIKTLSSKIGVNNE